MMNENDLSQGAWLPKQKPGREHVSPTLTVEERKQEQLRKKRISAKKSLQKKKEYMENLEQRAKFLSLQNEEMKIKIKYLLERLSASDRPHISQRIMRDIADNLSNADHGLNQLLKKFSSPTDIPHTEHLGPAYLLPSQQAGLGPQPRLSLHPQPVAPQTPLVGQGLPHMRFNAVAFGRIGESFVDGEVLAVDIEMPEI